MSAPTIKRSRTTWPSVFATVVIVSLVLAYSYITNRFGPGFSMYDKQYFGDSPHIAVHTDTGAYHLRWQYGSMGFFFHPDAKVEAGQLLFCLRATSSSGSRSGRYEEIPITHPAQIQALQRGGAFWLEPGGKKIRLEERKL